MPSVSDLISIELGIDSSGVALGSSDAEREVDRVVARVKQQASSLERVTRDIAANVFGALRTVAGLMGVALSVEGIRSLSEHFANSMASLGRFSEAVGVSSTHVSELEQALDRAGGRAGDVRSILQQMRSDMTRAQMTGETSRWMQTLGRAPFQFGERETAQRSPEDTLLDISRRAGAAHLTPSQLQQFLPGLSISPETLSVLANPRELQRILGDIRRQRTAVTPEQEQAGEHLKEKFSSLDSLTEATLRDLVTLSEPVLSKVLDWMTNTLDWFDRILRVLTGAPAIPDMPQQTAISPPTGGSRTPQSPGYSPGAGGPRVGGSGANYMRGELPGQGDLVRLQTASGAITVHKNAADDIKGFIDDLVAAGAPREEVGSHVKRVIAGTNTWSQHAYGTAIDYGQIARNIVDPKFREWANTHRDELEYLLRKHNMISGGNWRNPDFGHFEWSGPGRNTIAGVRGSTFSDVSTASGKSAATTSGIALPSGGKMGDLYEITTPDGRKFVAPLIDRGPANWTGRGVDISEELARRMGYDPKKFPTDSNFKVEPYTRKSMPDVSVGAGAALEAPQSIHNTINKEQTAVINHIAVTTSATDASGIAQDVRDAVGRELAMPAEAQ